MNKKEISELKKQFKLDNGYLTPNKIYNAYVSEQGDIIWKRFMYFDRLDDEDRLAYYDIFKKTLSGGLGKNINEYPFRDDSNNEGRENVRELLDDFTEDVVNTYVEKMISTLLFPYRYYISIAEFIYSVPPAKGKGKKNDENDASDFEDYHFIICSINTMDKKATGLAWNNKDEEVNYLTDGVITASKGPICGFLYPLFSDRTANCGGFMSYSKDKESPCIPLTVDILGGNFELTPASETELFHTVLRETCGGALKFGLAKDICTEISSVIRSNIEETEPPKIGIAELKGILTRNGMSEVLDLAEEKWKETFGSLSIQVLAANVTNENKTTIKAPDVSISMPTHKTAFVEEKVIDGVKCIVIPITDGGVTVNEMDIE